MVRSSEGGMSAMKRWRWAKDSGRNAAYVHIRLARAAVRQSVSGTQVAAPRVWRVGGAGAFVINFGGVCYQTMIHR